MFFDPRGRISRFQAIKYGLIISLIMAITLFAYGSFYIPGAPSVADLFMIAFMAICLGSGFVLMTKRFHDLGAPVWASEVVIAVVCAIYWFGFASPERAIEKIAIENLAQNPAPIVNSVTKPESSAVDPSLGELVAIVVSVDALNLSESQKIEMSEAKNETAFGVIAAWILGLALAVLIFLTPGAGGKNKYGPDPRNAA